MHRQRVTQKVRLIRSGGCGKNGEGEVSREVDASGGVGAPGIFDRFDLAEIR